MTLPSSGPLSLNDIQGEFGGSNPIGINEYYAGGGLVPAGTSGTYGAVPTSGQISIQNFYGTSNYIPVYIEDLFSTYLYTGNSSANNTISNGIDLSTKGGLVWIKSRDAAPNVLTDTARGTSKELISNSTGAQTALASTYGVKQFLTTGFVLGFGGDYNAGQNYASWTFRKQPKFFDVVTYTGNGTGQNIAHNLGSVPGCIIIKSSSAVQDWWVYHTSLGNQQYVRLNSTGAVLSSTVIWNSTTPTSTQFSVGNTIATNTNGSTYVAYLFAHDAGGFGLTGTDNVISCGSFTASGAGTVTLGYEPQWVLVKNASAADDWYLVDSMRGFYVPTSANKPYLSPNTSGAEGNTSNIAPTSTGFDYNYGTSGNTWIYIAIRRGPMKTPTSGTSVFQPLTHSGNSTARSITTSFPSDFLMVGVRNATSARFTNTSRLTANKFMWTSSANVENTNTAVFPDNVVTSTQNAFTLGDDAGSDWVNASGNTYVDYNFRRAPGFFDVVCYTGNGVSGLNVNHNLGVVPEMMIVKSRTVGSSWYVYTPTTGNTNTLVLDSTAAVATRNVWGDTTPTSSVFSVGLTGNGTNNSGATYVAYLFASCPGVSKVGSYSGTGATQTISCGFAARFVLIKRTDSTGNWWVWDTARGMVAGTDPRLPMNTITIESNANWVYTDASGFQIVTTDATVNASGGTYIYLAIA